jgi:hypothetical protein
VTAYVLNQSRKHQLLSDAFHSAISISLKLREEPKNASFFKTLMEEDSGVALEFICLASNIRKEVCGVFDSFISFLKKFEERKTHNVLVLMLDPRFNSLCLMSSFIGHDQGVAIVEQYDTMSLYLMLMKCYYHLYSSIESNNGFANQKVDDDNNLDIFQMIRKSTELAKELVKI